jgi:uncharacterized protein YerC
MQISAKNLTRSTESGIVNQLYSLLADLRTRAEVKAFLNDFLSETEQTVFAKRLAIAQLLTEGKSYKEIKASLKVSSATISSVAELIDKPGMALAQNKIELDRWAETVVNKLPKFLRR